MSPSTRNLVLLIVAALLVTAYSSVFTVTERDRALITRFGEIKRVVDNPGLYFKVPFVDDVVVIDKRLVLLENKDHQIKAGMQTNKRRMKDPARHAVREKCSFDGRHSGLI